MDFASYLAAFNARVQAGRDRKDEQEREAVEAKNNVLDAAADYMRDLATVRPDTDV